MRMTDKFQIAAIFKQRVISFYTTNMDKCRWLISKYIGIWFMNATEKQKQRLHKTLTSGNISIGKRGTSILFREIYTMPTGENGQCFHPHSCSNSLDMNCHGIFMGRDVINYQ